jgi:hypothetical protein
VQRLILEERNSSFVLRHVDFEMNQKFRDTERSAPSEKKYESRMDSGMNAENVPPGVMLVFLSRFLVPNLIFADSQKCILGRVIGHQVTENQQK